MKWFKFFEKKSQQPTQESLQELMKNAFATGIYFTVFDEDNVRIHFDFSDMSSDVSKLTGKLLYSLLNGGMKDAVFAQLAMLVQEEQLDREFVEQIMKSYYHYQERQQNQPIVSPTDVLKIDRIVQK